MGSVLPRKEDGILTLCSMVRSKFGNADPSKAVRHLLGSAEDLQREIERWKQGPSPDVAIRILDELDSIAALLSGLRYSSGLQPGLEVDRMLAFRLAIEQYHKWRANIVRSLTCTDLESWNF